MLGRQSSHKQNSGRGAPNSGRGPNNGRCNGQHRPPSTPTTTPKTSNVHHSTTSVPALVNNLLGRNSNSTTSSSNQTSRVPSSNGNPTASTEQARLEAENAFKSVEESNRQAEIQRKHRTDELYRAQAESLRLEQEADDNVIHENSNFPYMSNAFFNITSRDGFTFSKAMSPSFAFGGTSHVMLATELVSSPKLVMDELSTVNTVI
jgi:hypothetical protein